VAALPSTSARRTPGEVPLGAGPTGKFRRQHNEIEPPLVNDRHFRTAFRVKSRLDRLVSEKTITVREWTIAVEYRCIYAAAFRGAVQSTRLDGTGHGRSYRGSRLERSEGQLAALARLQTIRTALGAVETDLVEACAVRDQAWCETARALGRDPKTVRSWTLIALRRLAEVW
jgi:hypothetical protein